MNEEIFFDGEKYISANQASRTSGLTRDYIARLCKDSKIVGKRVGKNWYPQEKSFNEFMLRRDYATVVRSNAIAEQRKSEYRARDPQTIGPLNPPSHPKKGPKKAEIKPQVRASTMTGHFAQALNTAEEPLATQLLQAPSGIGSAALSALPMQLNTHLPTYAITPVTEFLHRFVALFFALLLTFGTFSLMNPQYGRFAADSLRDGSRTVIASVSSMTQASYKVPTSSELAAVATDAGEMARGLRGILYRTSQQAVGWIGDVISEFGKPLAPEVDTQKLCVSDASGRTCVTRGQFDALLESASRESPINMTISDNSATSSWRETEGATLLHVIDTSRK